MRSNHEIKQKKRQYAKAKRRIELGIAKPHDSYIIEHVGKQLNYGKFYEV